MKKILFLLLLIFCSCKISTEPQELIVEDQSVELRWIKYRNNYAWCLLEYSDLFLNIEYNKYECQEIVLYPTKLLFTYNINNVSYIQAINTGSFSYPDWEWQEM